ncbi:MAG: hypothetical protein HAW62_06540 [Endozoicomonadaceae bacterium]|nr:hypothetical protein [Endozoicomonadaceae bacterium]
MDSIKAQPTQKKILKNDRQSTHFNKKIKIVKPKNYINNQVMKYIVSKIKSLFSRVMNIFVTSTVDTKQSLKHVVSKKITSSSVFENQEVILEKEREILEKRYTTDVPGSPPFRLSDDLSFNIRSSDHIICSKMTNQNITFTGYPDCQQVLKAGAASEEEKANNFRPIIDAKTNRPVIGGYSEIHYILIRLHIKSSHEKMLAVLKTKLFLQRTERVLLICVDGS